MSAISRPLRTDRPQLSGRRPSGSAARYWGRRFIALILLAWSASFATGFVPALAILSGIAFAAAVFGVRRPALGLFGISMLCTLDVLMRTLLLTGGLLRWNSFNYWLLLVTLTAGFVVVTRSELQSRLLLAFILLLGLELLFSTAPSAGIQDLLGIVSLFGIMIYFARASGNREAWYWTGLVNGTLAAAGGLAYYLHGSRLPFVNPNAWSYFPLTAVFAICLAVPFASALRRGQVVLGVLAVVNSVWVFLSGSRGAFLIVVCCLIFLTARIGRGRVRLAFLAAGLVTGIALLAGFAEQQASSRRRFERLFSQGESLEVRTSGRSELAIVGWMVFAEHPLGIGTGSFGLAAAATPYGSGIVQAAHSAWVKTLVENGIPGVLLLGAYTLSFAIDGWRLRRRRVLGLGLLTAGALGVAFLSTEFQSKGVWFLAGGVTILLHERRAVESLKGVAFSKRLAMIDRVARRTHA